MGESVAALIQLLEGKQVRKIAYLDSSGALAIAQKPDGPWRTRHLRIRARALKEKLQQDWELYHISGKGLVADYLTKPIGVKSEWKAFFDFVQLAESREVDLEEAQGKVEKIKCYVSKFLVGYTEEDLETNEELNLVYKIILAVIIKICQPLKFWWKSTFGTSDVPPDDDASKQVQCDLEEWFQEAWREDEPRPDCWREPQQERSQDA